MAELDELDRYLASVRQALVGPAAMRERVEARLLSLPPAQPGASGVAADAARAARVGDDWPATGRRWLLRRLHPGTVAVLVGLGFGAGFWLGRQPQELKATSNVATTGAPANVAHATESTEAATSATTASNSPPVSAQALVVSAPSPSTIEPGRSAAQRMRSSAVYGRSRPPPAARSGSEEDDELAAEVAALARVERALRQGEALLALSLLEELDRAVPVATLGHERSAARVLARCISPAAREPGSSEARAARSGAERFLRQHVASFYSDRIRSACALEGAATRSKSAAGVDTQQSKETQ